MRDDVRTPGTLFLFLGLFLWLASGLALAGESNGAPETTAANLEAAAAPSATLPAMPKAAIPPAPQGATAGPNRDDGQRFELSFFVGGVYGSKFGSLSTTCTDEVAGSCDPNSDFTPNGIGFGPTALIPALPELLTSGGVEPGNGPSFGGRFGVDINPHWQVEFTFNYISAPFTYVNPLGPVDEHIRLFCDPDSFDDCGDDRSFRFTNRGQDQGNQQQWLVNVNYHFTPERRLVPYVGFGGGLVKWYNAPRITFAHTKDGPDTRFLYGKISSGDTAFAVDFAAGFKYHVTQHFGFRAELMDVVSFPEFTHEFFAIDVDDFFGGGPGSLGGPTGTLTQSTPFNQLNFNGGVFFRF